MDKLYVLEFLQSHGILKKKEIKKVACTCIFLQCKVMKQGQLFHIAENVLNMQPKLPDRLCAIASFFGVGLNLVLLVRFPLCVRFQPGC